MNEEDEITPEDCALAIVDLEKRIDFLEKEYNAMWQEMLSRVQELEARPYIEKLTVENEPFNGLITTTEYPKKLEDKYFIREGNK